MVCSPEQLASNRRNSLKSTGPGPESREKTRKNALKHGLTGEGIVVPDEDVAAIQERFDAFDADLNPQGVVPEYLVRHLALLSVRMDRSARQEAASLARNMLLAEQAEADAHRDELQALVDHISADPEVAYRKLQRSPRGLAWMIREWEDLQVDLADANPYRWSSARIERAENLIGHSYANPNLSRIGVLSNAYHGNFDRLKAGDWPDMPETDRKEAARAELGRFVDAEIARLKDVLENLDRTRLARIEAGAMARALFDASKEAVLARKYAAAAERGFFKTLKTIQELNVSANTVESAGVDDVSREKEEESGELALNCTEISEPALPVKRRPPAPADRRKSKAERRRRASDPAPGQLRE